MRLLFFYIDEGKFGRLYLFSYMDEFGWFFDELVYIIIKIEKVLIKIWGIVFRLIKYSELSVIVDIFMEEWGMCSYLVLGVRWKNVWISLGLL